MSLEEKGCERIYQEKVGSTKYRPELEKLIDNLRPGDEVIVISLDRLGRSLKNLLEIVETLRSKECQLISIHENIDTTTTTGKLFFNIFASLYEFERATIVDRTLHGLEAARKRGIKGGRKPGLSDENKKKALIAQSLYDEKKLSVKEICDTLNISRASFYRYIKTKSN
ncbi:recombinase family protein [Flammeovirga sp. SJP92]|uniref:recombinase family protein n=1 Tax=Flammeovirga sp. SJP92 TaxID=1775430 RepID=UPI0020A5D800|nr:recombinase family protein [Flammeovirga sp. SJP92]